MSLKLRIQLSTMMFLQYFIWGIWLPVLYQRLGENGLNLGDRPIALIFTVYGFGSILSPFVVGQLADRYFSTEKVMAFAHFFGGILLFATAYATTFWPIFLLLFVYCSLYMPTMALSNSITFRAIGEGNQDAFPVVRMFGTIGWIIAGLAFAAYRNAADLPALQGFFAYVGRPEARDCLRVAGIASMLYGLYCLSLPHTPPVPVARDEPGDAPGAKKQAAWLECLGLMRDRSFAVLIIVAGLIGIMLAFYFQQENPFLEAIGTKPESIGAYMTIGQVAEMLLIGLVPLAVSRFGVKNTMLIGAGAWAARFGLSMIGQPWWLMIATISFHGFCFGFFFVVAQMYVDRAAGDDIKASAQNLFVFIVYGIGTVVGNLLGGELRNQFGKDWTKIWGLPFVLTLLCIVAFALLFHDRMGVAGPAKRAEPELV